MVKKWPVEIGLHNVGLDVAVSMLLFSLNEIFNFIEGKAHRDASSPIGEFSGLHNPDILEFLASSLFFLLPFDLLGPLIETVEKLHIRWIVKS